MKRNSTLLIIMRIKCLFLISFWIWLRVFSACANEDFQKPILPTIVWTELGGEAVLPCAVSIPSGDKINMVLWFKDFTGIPIYSFDARGVDMSNGIHMAISDLEKRCFFSPSGPKGGHLKIQKINKGDAGSYKCRVDFLNSPTQLYKVNLTFADQPSMPIIFPTSSLEVESVAGPYREGDSLDLTCSVNTGNPTPQLTWWIENDQLTHAFVKEYDSKISSRLIMNSLPRSYNGKLLECRVNVSGISRILSETIHLNVYVKPIAVSVLSGNNFINDGDSTKFVCECFGSNPPAVVSWLLDREPIRSSAITAMHVGTTTTSMLTIRVDPSLNGKWLFCRCENLEFPQYYLEDKKLLQVHYKPIVQILTRPKYNFNKVREGDNVSLECSVNANPTVNVIRWFHDGKIVETVNNKSIYNLKDVSLYSEGDYECEASNKEGQSRSSKLTMNVLHAPFCQEGFKKQSIIATLHETIILQCEIESGMINRHVQFFWTLNNTRGVQNVVNGEIQSAGKVSILKYTPESEEDFGVLACWAQNDIGPQKIPCYFYVTLAHKPERLKNCVTNNSIQGLKISCEPGFDGGLQQYFVLEVRLANNSKVDIANDVIDQLNDEATATESKTIEPLLKQCKENPVFDIFSLQIGIPYIFILYAINLKGKSEPVVLSQEMKSSSTANVVVSSEISAAQDMVTIPTIYIAILALIILIASLVIMTAIILACRTNNVMRHENANNERNNFRIAYSI